MQLSALIDGLESRSARVRYGSLKSLKAMSEKSPEALYPRFNFFVRLLDSDNAFMRWDSMRILGNLAAADREERLDKVLDKLLAPVQGHQMIGAANAIMAAAKVARGKPHLAERIAKKILAVERASYATTECRNVAIGHAIKSFDQFFPLVRNKRPVLEFVTRQLANTRPATRKKAERFLKKWAADERE